MNNYNQYPKGSEWAKWGKTVPPLQITEIEINDYATFLEQRRKLMAAKMKAYYFSL